MSAKKKWFKPRTGWACDGGHWWNASNEWDPKDTHRVRVVDARELTAEQAAQKVLQLAYWDGLGMEDVASAFGMTATVKNGRVNVRKIKGEKA